MGVFKNGVGRPSNETIKKRNIFKVICVLLILVIIVLIGYILNDKNVDILHHFIFDLKTRLARYPIINAPEMPTAALSNPP